MKRFGLALTLGIVVLTGACQIRAQEATRKFVPVTDAMLEKPDPANWLMWRRTLDGWGYSPLNQINRTNVAQLRMVWTRGMATGRQQESTPLVYDGVMYLPNTGDNIQALDAQTGDLIWDYQRDLGERRRGKIAISRSTATPSSIPASTMPSSHSTRKPASSHGRRRSWIPANPPMPALARSSPTERSFRDVNASPARPMKAASLPRTMPKPARNSGAPAPSRNPANPAMKPGAACRWSSAGTSARGWCRATIRS